MFEAGVSHDSSLKDDAPALLPRSGPLLAMGVRRSLSEESERSDAQAPGEASSSAASAREARSASTAAPVRSPMRRRAGTKACSSASFPAAATSSIRRRSEAEMVPPKLPPPRAGRPVPPESELGIIAAMADAVAAAAAPDASRPSPLPNDQPCPDAPRACCSPAVEGSPRLLSVASTLEAADASIRARTRAGRTSDGRALAMKRCRSSSFADGLWPGSLRRHIETKSLNDREKLPSSNGGGFCGMCISACMGCICEYGGLPCASSMAVMPSDQMSAFSSCPPPCSPWMTSGAIQKGVPVNVLRFMQRVCVSEADTPKSASPTSPSAVKSTFAALISRCIMCSPCKYSNASRRLRMIHAMESSGSDSSVR
mmetsp:Transcript_25284/g.83050  ORF Transcript_25284/g.83050 Transcript_25284/m.83050 type:complete len:370 (-) Transcript_25284:236-1345(-)